MISFRMFGTSIKVNFMVLPIVLFLWGVVTWLGLYWHPERTFWQGLLIGLAASVLLLIAEFGHPFGHIFSARYARAPMDELVIAGDMPRTLYDDNDVAPNIHRMRALGGPIFNVVGLLLSIAIFEIVPGNPIARELLAWSAVGHGLLLIMSLSPMPSVDGGTILKWTLVERGKTEREADKIIQRVDVVIGIAGIIIGIGAIAMQIWMVGVVFMGIGIVTLGVAAGKIK
jgi:hypothetical protein